MGKRRLGGGWVINAQVMSKYAAIPNTALYLIWLVSAHIAQDMLRGFIVSVKESSLKYQFNVSLRKA